MMDKPTRDNTRRGLGDIECERDSARNLANVYLGALNDTVVELPGR